MLGSRRSGRLRRGLAALAAGAAAAMVLTTAGPAAARTPGTTPPAPAGVAPVACSSQRAGLAQRLSHDIAGALRGRSGTFALALYDRRTATTCRLKNDAPFDSASVVKVTVLGALLRQSMEQHRTLTPREVRLTTAMITKSDNAATSALWRQVGPGGIQRFLRLAGMHDTVAGPYGSWGLTQITAGDQVKLLRLLTSATPVLDAASRRYALVLMNRVVPDQRWGVPAGAPGTATVHVKNGWLSRDTHGWRVHSIGAFTDDGNDYGIAVLSHDNRTMRYGVDTVQRVAAVVHRDLAGAR